MCTQNPEEWLRPLIRSVVREVLSECGQPAPLKLYDVETAAKMLSVPKRWLYERTAKREIPYQKIGKYVRFSDGDLRQIAAKSLGKEPKDQF